MYVYMIYFSLQSDCFRIRLEVHMIPPGGNRLMCQQRVLKEKRTSLSLSMGQGTHESSKYSTSKGNPETSLVVQWLRIHLPMEGTRGSSPGPGRSHMPWSN